MLPARPPEAARENNKKDVPGAGGHDQDKAPERSREGRRENRGRAGSCLGFFRRNPARILADSPGSASSANIGQIVTITRVKTSCHLHRGDVPGSTLRRAGLSRPATDRKGMAQLPAWGIAHTPHPRRPSYLRIPRRLITSRYFLRSCSRKYFSRPDRFETIMSSPRRLAWSLACVLK